MTLGANDLGLVLLPPWMSRWFVQLRGMAIAMPQASNSLSALIGAISIVLYLSGYVLFWRWRG
jgi:hypothetical protein